jgi:hypothetical protein
MGVFDWVVWTIAVIILLPVLVSPAGVAFAVVAAVMWLIVAYGGRFVLEVERERRQGERGLARDIRNRGGGRE